MSGLNSGFQPTTNRYTSLAEGASLNPGIERPLFAALNFRYGSFAHCRIFESGRSAAILLTPLVEMLQ